MRQAAARKRLRRFRQGTMLAVALTAMLLLVLGEPEEAAPEPALPAVQPQESPAQPEQGEEALELEPPADPATAVEEAARTIRELLLGFYGFMPKLVIALILLALAALVARSLQFALRRGLPDWERADGLAALGSVAAWLLALGAALSVLAGDVRVLVGSVGLVGLAASWALQGPIEAAAGWLVNALKGYYRVGDRIAVGEVFGDVYAIDLLTTTVWEAGGPEKPVQGAQPTGALVTFPNSEVLRVNVVNLTRDFPYVWDEVTLGVTNETDLEYAAAVFRRVAAEVAGDAMAAAAAEYTILLERARIAFEAESKPTVFFSAAEGWVDATVRYLVPVRERRRRASDMVLALSREFDRPEHGGRIRPMYPRADIRVTGWSGRGDAAGEPGGAQAA